MMTAPSVTGTPIEVLKLTNRPYFALVRNGIETVEQLRQVPNFEALKGIRGKGAEEIRRKLRAYLSSQPQA